MAPDITMCQDGACPMRATCHRFTAKPTPDWQAYFAGSPRKGPECEVYWPTQTTQGGA